MKKSKEKSFKILESKEITSFTEVEKLIEEQKDIFCVSFVRNQARNVNTEKSINKAAEEANIELEIAYEFMRDEEVKKKIDRMKLIVKQTIDIDKEWLMLNYSEIVQRAMQQQAEAFSVECGLKALDALCKILGVYAPTQSVTSSLNAHTISDKDNDINEVLDHYQSMIDKHVQKV